MSGTQERVKAGIRVSPPATHLASLGLSSFPVEGEPAGLRARMPLRAGEGSSSVPSSPSAPRRLCLCLFSVFPGLVLLVFEVAIFPDLENSLFFILENINKHGKTEHKIPGTWEPREHC